MSKLALFLITTNQKANASFSEAQIPKMLFVMDYLKRKYAK